MNQVKPFKYGFIGCGHMGLAIIKGAIQNKLMLAAEICVYVPSVESQEKCHHLGLTVLENNQQVCQQAHYVFLAVRPQVATKLLTELQLESIDVLVSMVAGLSIASIQNVNPQWPIIRLMPNTPLEINEGATAISHSDNVLKEELDSIFNLFNSLGTARIISETFMDEVIAVSGSTPAYLYLFMKEIIDDVVQRGMDKKTVRELLVQTFIGAAKLVKNYPNKSLNDFIHEVCTPHGTTIEAVTVLKDNNLNQIVSKANSACIKRSKELGHQNKRK